MGLPETTVQTSGFQNLGKIRSFHWQRVRVPTCCGKVSGCPYQGQSGQACSHPAFLRDCSFEAGRGQRYLSLSRASSVIHCPGLGSFKVQLYSREGSPVACLSDQQCWERADFLVKRDVFRLWGLGIIPGNFGSTGSFNQYFTLHAFSRKKSSFIGLHW